MDAGKLKLIRKNSFAVIAAMMAVALIFTGSVSAFAAEKVDATTPSAIDSGVAGTSVQTSSDLVPSVEIDWQNDAPAIAGTSAILMDAGTGEILYEKNGYELRDPASITKILNCLVVLENMDLSQTVTIPYQPSDIGNNMGLKKGEVLTVEQLVYAMMVYSANDAAEALAVLTGGSVENFCSMMNERARRCGAEHTNFTNANGLNTWGQDHHRTTAYDLAMISREAMKNPTFRKIVSTKSYVIPATNLSEARKFVSTNYCLYSGKPIQVNGAKRPFKYDGMTGIKTGYTGTSGYCFCGSAKRDGMELIAVSLNSGKWERYGDVMAMMDYGFSKYHVCTAAEAKTPVGTAKIKRGARNKVDLKIAEDMNLLLNQDVDSKSITTEVTLSEKKFMAPVRKGETLGTLTAFNAEGEPVARTEVFAAADVEKGGLLSYIGIADNQVPLFIVTVILVILILSISRSLIRQRKRKQRRRQRAQLRRQVRERERARERDPFDPFH